MIKKVKDVYKQHNEEQIQMKNKVQLLESKDDEKYVQQFIYPSLKLTAKKEQQLIISFLVILLM